MFVHIYNSSGGAGIVLGRVLKFYRHLPGTDTIEGPPLLLLYCIYVAIASTRSAGEFGVASLKLFRERCVCS